MTKAFWRFLTWTQSVSVRTKILGLTVGATVLMGTGAVVVARGALLASARVELERHAVAVAQSLAARSIDPVLTGSTFSLYQLLGSVRQGDPDVRYAFVVNGEGEVMAHTFRSGFPRDLLRLSPPGDGDAQVTRLQTEEGIIHDVAVPLLGGQFGYVRVGLTEQRLQEAAQGLLAGMVQAVIAVAGVAMLAALGLTELIIRPLRQLTALTRAVARGDLTQQAQPGPPDEFGSLVEAFNGMVGALAASARELQAKEQARQDLLQRVMTAQEDERRRISRELHDEAGQALTGLMVGLRTLMDKHPEIRPRAEELRQLTHDTLDGLRRLSVELRPQALDDLGLTVALRRYLTDYGRQHGVAVDLQVLGSADRRLPSPVETCLYRVVQEALTNSARHAQAQRVSVVLDLRPGAVSVIVEDNGRGFVPEEFMTHVHPDGRGLGLFGMQERVQLVGGTLQIESAPGQGTTVFVKCPIREGASHGIGKNPAGR